MAPDPWGAGLASRFAAAGQQVRIGSRDAAPGTLVCGVTRCWGRRGLERWRVRRRPSHSSPSRGRRTTTTLTGLRDALMGRIVIDCVNPLGLRRAWALRASGATQEVPPSGRRSCCRRASLSARSTTCLPSCFSAAGDARRLTCWSSATIETRSSGSSPRRLDDRAAWRVRRTHCATPARSRR